MYFCPLQILIHMKLKFPIRNFTMVNYRTNHGIPQQYDGSSHITKVLHILYHSTTMVISQWYYGTSDITTVYTMVTCELPWYHYGTSDIAMVYTVVISEVPQYQPQSQQLQRYIPQCYYYGRYCGTLYYFSHCYFVQFQFV